MEDRESGKRSGPLERFIMPALTGTAAGFLGAEHPRDAAIPLASLFLFILGSNLFYRFSSSRGYISEERYQDKNSQDIICLSAFIASAIISQL